MRNILTFNMVFKAAVREVLKNLIPVVTSQLKIMFQDNFKHERNWLMTHTSNAILTLLHPLKRSPNLLKQNLSVQFHSTFVGNYYLSTKLHS